MMSSSNNLVTTIIGFGLSATFIVFVCTRLICGRFRERHVGSRTIYEMESRPDIERNIMVMNLNLHLLLQSPLYISMKRPSIIFSVHRCVICLGEYKEKEILRIIPYCGHTFHLSCIDMWLRKQSTCPVCRLTLHNVCEEKHVRPVTFTIRQSLDESNSTSEGNERQGEVNAREIESS
ncbi:RING-H2 finger protein ATL39 isoform X2 [Medicago truncatula]|uniref:RING-H2 finger protein ATL39 isoform X2 n=1 Tax=Medicago truncatula TaxID=3880 RepID=UPI000D2F1658|nr:RING-H2 finger protein ATL39 isoform X2 [Medicago truncatula]